MQAIVTKYIGPTNSRGSRVKATCQAGSITVGWDDGLDQDDNHDAAAVALARKLGWTGPSYGKMARGALPSGAGNVYVFGGGHVGGKRRHSGRGVQVQQYRQQRGKKLSTVSKHARRWPDVLPEETRRGGGLARVVSDLKRLTK